MRIFVLSSAFMMILASFGLCAERAKSNADSVQTVLDRLGKMTPPEQQAWLQHLEKRAVRAARLALKPDEAVRQQAKTHARLHQKMITWKVLREVIDDTDTREKDAVDRLVRQYRALVFDTFYKQIDVYNKRQEAWRDVYLDWKNAGAQFEQQDRLIDWLEQAIRSATPGAIGPIPEKPKFESQSEPAKGAKPQAADKQPAKDAKPRSTPKSETKDAKPQAVKTPGEETPKPTAPPRAAEPALPQPKPSPPPLNPSAAAIPLRRQGVEQRGAKPIELGRSPAPVPRRQEVASRPVGDASVSVPRHTAQTIGTSQPTMRERVVRPVAAVDLPQESRVPPPSSGQRPAERATTADDAPSDAVEVKVDELAAQIGGCNMAFRALETELDENGPWTAARLEPLVDRLKILVIRHNDLQLFREAVAAGQRSSIESVASAKGVVSQVAACIVAARKGVSGPDFKGTEAERQAELGRLEGLSRRLAELAGK